MAKKYDSAVKGLVERRPADWLRLAGLPNPEAARVVDADVGQVTAAGDKVLFVDGPEPYVAHFEFQAGADPDLDLRVMMYNVLLRCRHKVPVRSVGVLLRPAAESRRVVGRFEERAGPSHAISFEYELLRPWKMPVDDLLAGGPGTVPLASLAVESTALTDTFERIDQRLRATMSEAMANELLAAAFVVGGLRHKRAVVDRLRLRFSAMRESVAYQLILEEGEAKGEVKGERKALLRFGRDRFGEPPTDVLAVLDGIQDPARLEVLIGRVMRVSSWTELLAAD